MPDRPLTILQVLPALHSGGVERGTLEVNRALVQQGHRSLVVSAGGPLVKLLLQDGGEHITLPVGQKRPWTLMHAASLRRLMLSQRVDLVHSRSRMPAWVTWLAWRSLPNVARPRFVTTVHGMNSVNWYSKVMTYGERVIAVSETCRQYVLQNYPDVDPQKLVVIYRGVSAEQFPYGHRPDAAWQRAWAEQFPRLAGQFVVALPGRLTRFKGHLDFLQILGRARQLGVPAHGLIVGGEDPRRQAYARQVRQTIIDLGLQDHVTLTGHRTDIRDVLSQAAAVVSTSIHPPESFGRAVLEAVRLGRPTLGYDHGGVGEVLRQIYPAGLVPLRDQQTMAQKLQAIYQQQLAPPARTEQFDLETMLRREVQLYEELVLGTDAPGDRARYRRAG